MALSHEPASSAAYRRASQTRVDEPLRHGDGGTWRKLCDLLDNHYGSTFELTARFTAIGVGSVAVWYLVGDIEPLIWCAAYIASAIIIWLYIRRIRAPGTVRQYRTTLAMDMVQSLIFISIVPYGALVAPPEAAIAPFAVVAGFAIYNIARCTPIPVIVLWESALTIGAVVWSCWIFLQKMGPSPGAYAAVAIKVIIILYSAVVAWDGLRRILQEREIERRTIAAQRVEAVGQLTAGLAHEFNNILAGIHGHLELAEVDPEPDARARSLAAARAGTQRAARHVKQLLSFARKAPVRPTPTELNGLMSASQQLSESLLAGKRKLTLESDVALLGAVVDPTALEGAIANLVLNARDAGASRVTLQLTRKIITSSQRLGPNALLLPGPYAVIACLDDGPGIPESTRDRVSEPFYTIKPPGQGTGLGLSMVRGTAEQMGGGIMIGSSKYGGASVAILLPECALQDLAPVGASAPRRLH